MFCDLQNIVGTLSVTCRMSESHSKEDLITYVKKAKSKIRKLEQEVATLKDLPPPEGESPALAECKKWDEWSKQGDNLARWEASLDKDE